MEEYKIRGSFICDNCRNICKGGCHEELFEILYGNVNEGSEEYERGKDLIGRKQIVTCLGKYCDQKCKYNRDDYTPFKEDDGLKPLFNLIKWMGNRLHDVIEENERLKQEISYNGNTK